MNVKKYFSRRVRHSLYVLFGLTFGIHFLDSRGYLHGPQTALGLDPMLQVTASHTPTEIGIVEITEDDYRDYFCGQSPLDGRGVLALVLAVREKLHPAVIGVDLDTSDWKPRQIPTPCTKLDSLRCPQQQKKGDDVDAQACMDQEVDRLVRENYPTKVVWAQVPLDKPTEGLKWWKWLVTPKGLRKLWGLVWSGELEEPMVHELQNVAGRSADSLVWGIPMFPVDRDGAVRRYRRRIKIEPERDDTWNSFPHALASACESCIVENGPWYKEERHQSSDDLILKLFADKSVFNPKDAKDLLPLLMDDHKPRPTQAYIDRALAVRPLQIVLIGGSYKSARDIYQTPLGEMPGVLLLAQAVETDLYGGISETGDFQKIFWDLLAGVGVIVLWNWKLISDWFSPRTIFILSLIGIPGAFLLLSFYLFHHRIWLDSIAILVGVVIHQVIEEFDKIKEYKEDIAHRDCTIRGLKKRLKEE
jgi:hypothetical protein